MHDGMHFPLSSLIRADQPGHLQRLTKMPMIRKPSVPRAVDIQPASWGVRTTPQVELLHSGGVCIRCKYHHGTNSKASFGWLAQHSPRSNFSPRISSNVNRNVTKLSAKD